jgi:CheY-like chemotaxis protein
LIREILEKYGYTVLEAANGNQAMRVYQQYKDTIHLLMTDVVMPLMGGRDLVRHLTVSQPDLKILYMSGYTDDAIINQGVFRSGTGFLQKPFSTEGLLNKVREVLDDAAASDVQPIDQALTIL